MYAYLAKRRHWLLHLMLPLVLFSCTEVRLIGAYDQAVDESIQKLSKDIATLLIELEKNHTDGRDAENNYTAFRSRYTDIEAETASLKIRSNALPKYKIISAQVALLDSNIRILETLHKTNFSAAGSNPVPVIQNIRTQFEVAFTAMLALQNGLKREKADRNK